MKKSNQTLVDESGIEVLVSYRYEESPSFEAEPGNPNTFVSEMVYTELDSVEVIIKGVGIDILPYMSERQKDAIVHELNYE